jgi:hypothetical protein
LIVYIGFSLKTIWLKPAIQKNNCHHRPEGRRKLS